MVPQVITAQELVHVKSTVDRLTTRIEEEFGAKLQFSFGTMIETVRACARAGRLAANAGFFSFGTNDLTQATFSFSREDAENKFLPMYNDMGILQDNPFEVLDIKGLGQLIQMAVERGREVREDLKIGICGEHGGHPRSIAFCHHIGLDYVSCSGPRVPVARLAVAHAKLLEREFAKSLQFANRSTGRGVRCGVQRSAAEGARSRWIMLASRGAFSAGLVA
jgi:pyruvate,orthophosphate dikinase